MPKNTNYRSRPYAHNGTLIFDCVEYDTINDCYLYEPFTLEFCQFTGSAVITLRSRYGRKMDLSNIENYTRLQSNSEGRKVLRKVEQCRLKVADLLPNRASKHARREHVKALDSGQWESRKKVCMSGIIANTNDRNMALSPEERRAKTARIKAAKKAAKQ